MKHSKKERSSEKIASLLASKSLRELNDRITESMSDHTIQPIIKGTNLDEIIQHVNDLAREESDLGRLLAAAILLRLAAVTRGRAVHVYSHIKTLELTPTPSIEELRDGDEKLYAAQALRHDPGEWVPYYCVEQALLLREARNARRELLAIALDKYLTLENWICAIAQANKSLGAHKNTDQRIRRARDVVSAMAETADSWHGDPGNEFGRALADGMDVMLRPRPIDADQEIVFDLLESTMRILKRAIELRFSNALEANTYSVLGTAKRRVGAGAWSRYIERSEIITATRTDLLESALVLARQNRTDKQLLEVLRIVYSSDKRLIDAVKQHFKSAKDVDPDVRAWWVAAGKKSDSSGRIEHQVGNTEDQQIGLLLIEVESNKEAVEKLDRAAVPFLKISDPVLASTVQKAAAGYSTIGQIARRLARIRRLTKTDLKGEYVEYNPQEHEMLGGHRAGVRKVRVVRDGVRKEFGNRVKTLVKPWVEPDE